MNEHASPGAAVAPADMSLAAVLAALEGHGEKPLLIESGGRRAQPGYHRFDVALVTSSGAAAVLQLGARPAICKPRHRAGREAGATCCGSTSATCC